MDLFSQDLIWWITVFDLPAMTGLFVFIWRTRRDSEQTTRHLRDVIDTRSNQLRDALSAFKLEVAKSYASINDMRELESRLVNHLLRIEAKLDKTAMKTEALSAEKRTYEMKYLEPSGKGNEDNTAQAFQKEQEVDVLARTLWGEARGEGPDGMHAVANVIMNRVKTGGWWGDSIIGVCQKPYQFSCWNKDDPNYRRLLAIDMDNLEFLTALRIARRAIYTFLPDLTCGADHYHAAGIYPLWCKGERPVTVIGNHIFYKLTKG